MAPLPFEPAFERRQGAMKPASIVQRAVLARNIWLILQEATDRVCSAIDKRNLRTVQALIWAIGIRGTTRLKQLAQALLKKRRAKNVKNVETGLSASLTHAQYDESALFTAYGEQVLQRIPAEAYERYRGLPIILEDPTTYEKRTRRGKAGLTMEYPSQLKDLQVERYPKGYVDAWAGPLLKRRRWLPLARGRFSNTHPTILSQNLVEEAVLERAIQTVGAPVLVIGDRGLSRKAKFAWLRRRNCHALYRMRKDIHVLFRGVWRNVLETAERLPFLGPAVWKKRSVKRRVRGHVTAFRAYLDEEGNRPQVWFVVFWPEHGGAPFILATTLEVSTLVQARTVLRLYAKRWAIETGFQQLKGRFGLEKFMVRAWQAVERVLNLVAMAYMTLLLLLICSGSDVREMLAQAKQLLAQVSVWKKVLTIGKLQEAIALDFQEHHDDWLSTLV
jgi:hypothetical protein